MVRTNNYKYIFACIDLYWFRDIDISETMVKYMFKTQPYRNC